jgi:hypothetical protein
VYAFTNRNVHTAISLTNLVTYTVEFSWAVLWSLAFWNDTASFGEWFQTMQHSMLKTTILYRIVISSPLPVLGYVRN